jgi:crotonobetainyl-CoA:carnitine CoA-transferase CaiB-like acyl-CoA transferase
MALAATPVSRQTEGVAGGIYEVALAAIAMPVMAWILALTGHRGAGIRQSDFSGGVTVEGPLSGVNVLCLAQVISAPSGVRLLADLGATVIKIEPPQGDVMRRITPLTVDDRGVEQSGFFIALNCGKKGVALDLKRPEGRQIVRRLAVEWADVFVENFTPGTLERYQLDYENLAAANPRLIYASLTGYGHGNDMTPRRSYDICVQGESGLTSINGEQGRRPHRIGFSVADYGAGRDMVIGILSALHHRERTGKGLFVDSAMYDTCVSFTENAIPRYSMKHEVAEALGNRHPAACPHNLFSTRDGFVNIIAIDDKLWARLAAAMERPDLITDPEMATAKQRLGCRDRVEGIVEAWTSPLTTAEVVARLEAQGLPYGVLRNIEAVIQDPQTAVRELAPEVQQPHLGALRVPGCPVKFVGARSGVQGPAPLLGEHNREVLGGILGMSSAEIEGLLARGILAEESAAPRS